MKAFKTSKGFELSKVLQLERNHEVKLKSIHGFLWFFLKINQESHLNVVSRPNIIIDRQFDGAGDQSDF